MKMSAVLSMMLSAFVVGMTRTVRSFPWLLTVLFCVADHDK